MSATESALEVIKSILEGLLPIIVPFNTIVYPDTPVPEQYLLGAPDLRRASQMPIIAVDIDRAELQTRTMGGVNVSRRQRVIPAIVYIYHAGRDEETLLRQLIRLTDATIQCLETVPQTSDYLFQTPRLVDFSPPVEGAGQPYLRVASISVHVITVHSQGRTR